MRKHLVIKIKVLFFIGFALSCNSVAAGTQQSTIGDIIYAIPKRIELGIQNAWNYLFPPTKQNIIPAKIVFPPPQPQPRASPEQLHKPAQQPAQQAPQINALLSILPFGIAECKGRRPTMEDTSVIVRIRALDTIIIALFDGHGGTEVSKACKKLIPELFLKKLRNQTTVIDYEAILRTTFEEVDNIIRNNSNNDGTGATAAVGIIQNSSTNYPILHIAWAGDSRIICINNNGEIVSETEDHDMHYNEDDFNNEDRRIQAYIKQHPNSLIKKQKTSGGAIRLIRPHIGGINMARAMGDAYLKPNPGQNNMLIATPDYQRIDLANKNVRYILFACDGMFEDLVHKGINDKNQNIKKVKDLLSLLKQKSLEVLYKCRGININRSGNTHLSNALGHLACQAFENGSGDNISAILYAPFMKQQFAKEILPLLSPQAIAFLVQLHKLQQQRALTKRK